MVHDDIVVAKLKPGQRIEFEAHCRKGVGECSLDIFVYVCIYSVYILIIYIRYIMRAV